MTCIESITLTLIHTLSVHEFSSLSLPSSSSASLSFITWHIHNNAMRRIYERLFPPIPNTYCVSFNYNSINICLLCLLLLLLLIYIFVIHCQLFCICWWHKIFPFSSKKQMQVKICLIEKIAKNMSINIFSKWW